MAESGDTNGATPQAFFEAGCYMVMRCVSDRVLPVYKATIELALGLVVSLTESFPTELPKELVMDQLNLLFPAMVPRTAERNARVVEATHRVLLGLAKSPAVGCRGLMAHVLVSVPVKDFSGIRGRLELLEQMIEEFSFSKTSGLSLSALMSYVRPHLEAADEKVRMAAVEVTVSCFYHKGDRTQQHVANLKPALLKILERRFAEVGTKNNGKGKKKGGVRAGARQLPALKGQQGHKQGKPLGEIRGTSRQSSSSSGSSAEPGQRMSSRGSQSSRGSIGKGPLGPLGQGRPGALRAASRGSLGSPFSLMGESHSMSMSTLGSPLPVHVDPLSRSPGVHALVAPIAVDSFGMSAMDLNAMEIQGFGKNNASRDLLSPPVNHGTFTEDPMRSLPGEGSSQHQLSDHRTHSGGSLNSPKRRNILANEEREEELGSDEELDFECAERLMDEIEGLEGLE